MGQDGERWLDRMIAAAYRKVVESYMRYVLLRCSEFTNSKDCAKEMAVGMLAAVCAMMPELDEFGELGQLVDFVVEPIREELRIKDWLAEQGQELLTDEWLGDVAAAVNCLEGVERQVIVLYYIEGLEVEQIMAAVGKSVGEIEASLRAGEKLFIENLAELADGGEEMVLCTRQIPVWLGQLGKALDLVEKDEMVRMVCGCMRSMEEDMGRARKFGFCKSLN